jgi:hypothetical protein
MTRQANRAEYKTNGRYGGYFAYSVQYGFAFFSHALFIFAVVVEIIEELEFYSTENITPKLLRQRTNKHTSSKRRSSYLKPEKIFSQAEANQKIKLPGNFDLLRFQEFHQNTDDR